MPPMALNGTSTRTVGSNQIPDIVGDAPMTAWKHADRKYRHQYITCSIKLKVGRPRASVRFFKIFSRTLSEFYPARRLGRLAGRGADISTQDQRNDNVPAGPRVPSSTP